MQPKATLEDTLALMRDLRARCEWDAAQTHESLRPYLVEEAAELDDAIRLGDDPLIREELGDVLLQVLFHSVVAEERGAFDMGDVAAGLIAKMHARHPHLYGGGDREPWERMKARKRARRSRTGCRRACRRCTARIDCRIALPVWASTGPMSKDRRRRSKRRLAEVRAAPARAVPGPPKLVRQISRPSSATCSSRS